MSRFEPLRCDYLVLVQKKENKTFDYITLGFLFSDITRIQKWIY